MKRVVKKKTPARKGTALALPTGYVPFLQAVKDRIRAAQVRATLSANSEMIRLYWDIGRAIAERQEQEGWGAAIIPRLARDIRNELPEVKGFSERNLKYMIRLCREYGPPPIVQQAAAQLPIPAKQPQYAATMSEAHPSPIVQQLVAQLPWFHNIVLMEKVKDLPTRLWYMQQTLEQGWSRNILTLMIDNQAHERQGRAVHNFQRTLPTPQSDLAEQVLKDPYIFDFLTLAEPFRERELEVGLLRHVEKFLLELGQGFAFVGRQFHLDVGENDFYLDLLFYHLRLRCFVVVDLKKGAFRAEYAGKMNFYCNVVDDRLRHPDDQPTVGVILCQEKNRVVAEYALKGVNKAIGVFAYQLTRALPKELQSSLPTVEEMEARLTELTAPKPRARRRRT
jgi:predicted nuclease of restriction endonuclease-like (RecB) superfamily